MTLISPSEGFLGLGSCSPLRSDATRSGATTRDRGVPSTAPAASKDQALQLPMPCIRPLVFPPVPPHPCLSLCVQGSRAAHDHIGEALGLGMPILTGMLCEFPAAPCEAVIFHVHVTNAALGVSCSHAWLVHTSYRCCLCSVLCRRKGYEYHHGGISRALAWPPPPWSAECCRNVKCS